MIFFWLNMTVYLPGNFNPMTGSCCFLTDVTKYLLFLAQASHELVPPDVSHNYIGLLL